eukprot:TRINITY_DN796_c1_g2_i1.p1 TRINITY_DN796_c1_g2~~TRINITY_DN796_c1_g2_i1.p1  ORF type:complete len:1720 (-),score=311.98 TRINITY_DN796_c1_g2_i1:127-5286(-)
MLLNQIRKAKRRNTLTGVRVRTCKPKKKKLRTDPHQDLLSPRSKQSSRAKISRSLSSGPESNSKDSLLLSASHNSALSPEGTQESKRHKKRDHSQIPRSLSSGPDFPKKSQGSDSVSNTKTLGPESNTNVLLLSSSHSPRKENPMLQTSPPRFLTSNDGSTERPNIPTLRSTAAFFSKSDESLSPRSRSHAESDDRLLSPRSPRSELNSDTRTREASTRSASGPRRLLPLSGSDGGPRSPRFASEGSPNQENLSVSPRGSRSKVLLGSLSSSGGGSRSPRFFSATETGPNTRNSENLASPRFYSSDVGPRSKVLPLSLSSGSEHMSPRLKKKEKHKSVGAKSQVNFPSSPLNFTEDLEHTTTTDEYEEFKVHDGMWRCAMNIFAQIEKCVLDLLWEHNNCPIIVTGHSLGAGTCTLLAIIMKDAHPEWNIHAWAYACPPVLSLEKARSVGSWMHSVTLNSDVIPRLTIGSLYDLKARIKITSEENPRIVEMITGLAKGSIAYSCSSLKKKIIKRYGEEGFSQFIERMMKVKAATEKIYTPGKCIFICCRENSDWKLKEGTRLFSNYVDNSKFDEIVLCDGTQMFVQHLPHQYEKGLRWAIQREAKRVAEERKKKVEENNTREESENKTEEERKKVEAEGKNETKGVEGEVILEVAIKKEGNETQEDEIPVVLRIGGKKERKSRNKPNPLDTMDLSVSRKEASQKKKGEAIMGSLFSRSKHQLEAATTILRFLKQHHPGSGPEHNSKLICGVYLLLNYFSEDSPKRGNILTPGAGDVYSSDETTSSIASFGSLSTRTPSPRSPRTPTVFAAPSITLDSEELMASLALDHRYLSFQFVFLDRKKMEALNNNNESIDAACIKNFESFTGLRRDSLLVKKWKGKKPWFLLCFDPETKSLVLAINSEQNLLEISKMLNCTTVIKSENKLYDGTTNKFVWEEAVTVFNEIEPVLKQFMLHSTYPLVVTGHGFGAAVAGLLSYLLKKEHKKWNISSVLFGCPPIFPPNIAQEMSEFTKTYVLNKEVVPRLTKESTQDLNRRIDLVVEELGSLKDRILTRIAAGENPFRKKEVFRHLGALFSSAFVGQWSKKIDETRKKSPKFVLPGNIVFVEYSNKNNYGSLCQATAHDFEWITFSGTRESFHENGLNYYEEALRTLLRYESLETGIQRSNIFKGGSKVSKRTVITYKDLEKNPTALEEALWSHKVPDLVLLMKIVPPLFLGMRTWDWMFGIRVGMLASPSVLPVSEFQPSKNRMRVGLHWFGYAAATLSKNLQSYDEDSIYTLCTGQDISSLKYSRSTAENVHLQISVDMKLEAIVVSVGCDLNLEKLIRHVVSDAIDISEKCLVHRTAYTIIQQINDDALRDAIKSLHEKHPHFKIVFTGHSFGGAVASLLCFFVQKDHHFMHATFCAWTFGAPAFMNTEISNYKIYNIVYESDVIPRLSTHSIHYIRRLAKVLVSLNKYASEKCRSSLIIEENLFSSVQMKMFIEVKYKMLEEIRTLKNAVAGIEGLQTPRFQHSGDCFLIRKSPCTYDIRVTSANSATSVSASATSVSVSATSVSSATSGTPAVSATPRTPGAPSQRFGCYQVPHASFEQIFLGYKKPQFRENSVLTYWRAMSVVAGVKGGEDTKVVRLFEEVEREFSTPQFIELKSNTGTVESPESQKRIEVSIVGTETTAVRTRTQERDHKGRPVGRSKSPGGGKFGSLTSKWKDLVDSPLPRKKREEGP